MLSTRPFPRWMMAQFVNAQRYQPSNWGHPTWMCTPLGRWIINHHNGIKTICIMYTLHLIMDSIIRRTIIRTIITIRIMIQQCVTGYAKINNHDSEFMNQLYKEINYSHIICIDKSFAKFGTCCEHVLSWHHGWRALRSTRHPNTTRCSTNLGSAEVGYVGYPLGFTVT